MQAMQAPLTQNKKKQWQTMVLYFEDAPFSIIDKNYSDK